MLVGESPETLRKVCLSAKFPHQEIRWNYGIYTVLYICYEKKETTEYHIFYKNYLKKRNYRWNVISWISRSEKNPWEVNFRRSIFTIAFLCNWEIRCLELIFTFCRNILILSWKKKIITCNRKDDVFEITWKWNKTVLYSDKVLKVQ